MKLVNIKVRKVWWWWWWWGVACLIIVSLQVLSFENLTLNFEFRVQTLTWTMDWTFSWTLDQTWSLTIFLTKTCKFRL